MRIVKTVLCVILALISILILVFAGSFLFRAVPAAHTEPPVILDTADIFPEEEMLVFPEEEPEEPVEEEVPPVEEAPAEPTPAEIYLQGMTEEEKLWQLFFVRPEDITNVNTATRAGETTQKALEAMPVGGICYFAENLEDQEQAVEMLSKTQSYAKTPMFLAVDEEGGSVSRAGANEKLDVTHFPAAAEYGKTGDNVAVLQMGMTLATELKALGFNLNFAPVADTVTNPNNTEIGDRAYSDDPETAALLVAAMVEGQKRNGMISCLKHFPGHGSTEGDSHENTVTSARTLEELQQNEWLPFRAGIGQGAAFVMVSHLTNENLSAQPASLSPEVMNFLRQELGFEGVIITDSLQMKAITGHYGADRAAVMALQAGADMLLMPNSVEKAYNGITAALEDGSLTWEQIDEKVLRILTVKYEYGILN